MKFIETDIEGVYLIEPQRIGDNRGYFAETYRADLMNEVIGPVNFVQDNESLSRRGVARGLHFQAGEYSQAKLVRVSEGVVRDYVVDLRESSPTFGQHFEYDLTAESGMQLFVPRGFAHGFVVLSDIARFQYKTDNYYAPQSERCLLFTDPDLGIVLPLPVSQLIFSPKDLCGNPLSETEHYLL